MGSKELDKDLFTNWVRGAKGLEYLQEGLQEFVGEKVLQCRDNTLQNIKSTLPSGSPQQCNQCTENNLSPEHFNSTKACNKHTCSQKSSNNCFGSRPVGRRKCPANGICSKFYDAIIDEHAFKDPLWKNTDPRTWCSDPHGWSYAKCFQTTKGPGTSAQDTDAAGLLSIIINNKSIQNFVTGINPHTKSSFHTARDIRNEILHSSKLEIDETTVCSFLDAFIVVLQDPKGLINDEASKNAVHKLTQLKNNTIHISQEDTVSLFENRNKALSELDERTAESLLKLDEKALAVLNKFKEDVNEVKDAALADVKNAVQTLSAERGDAISDARSDMSIFQIVRRMFWNVFIYFMGWSSRKKKVQDSNFEQFPVVKLGSVSFQKIFLVSTSELKDELITWYNNNQSTVYLSPLTDAFPTPLAGFYIMPEIDIQTYLPGGRKETTRVKSLQDLFTSGRKVPREIYLSAVAGYGKTAFSKYLAITWCQAHKKDENYKHFKEEELKALSGFEFLFLVLLRDSAKVCDVDDMIEQQIINNLPCKSEIPKTLLNDILRDEKCLVILDGLDEWLHPENKCTRIPKSIPHRYAREKCVILTTTRPWKLGVSNFKTSQMDKTVELVKLNKDNSRQFKLNALKMLNVNLQDGELENEVCRFEEEISNHDLEDMEYTPLLLLYLICLWVEKIPIGNSAVELYTGIIQLLLSRTEKLRGKFHSSCEIPPSNVPECFRKHQHCCRYYMFLKTIGKLAFYTLFSKKKEHTLVFDKNVVEIYLNEEDLKSSCLSGILSESKVKTLINESSKISFSHKTVQEYFSAIFISFQNTEEVQKIIFEECNCLQNILDMSKVFGFISYMNPKLMSTISSDLMPVINNDEKTSKYRTLTGYDDMYIDPLQDMYISCAKESQENKDLKLCLQDFFINEKCQQENYFKQLQHLCQQNKENIKSIMIENEGICSVQEIISLFTLSDLPHIEKLYYEGEIVEEEIMSLLLNPLKCLSVISRKWENHEFVGKRCQLSAEINGRLVKLQHLECLFIDGFTMTHDVMETLLNFLTSKKSMKEITLFNLFCSDHKNTSCRGFNLDLSQHSQLRCLGLMLIPVSQLNMDVSLLEECRVGQLYKPGVVSSYLSQLPAASKLQTFKCTYLESSSDIETMLQTLSLLYHVKYVRLYRINLGERSLTLSPQMINIEDVHLCYITMSCSVLYDLITVINKLPHTVTVNMASCDIKPETKFENFKTFIKQSDNFVVTYDGTLKSGVYRFVFKTTTSTE